MDDYEILKFAALFHDIGKFSQRADSNIYKGSKYSKLNTKHYGRCGAHGKWSADFVKDYFDENVESLVLYHHNPNNSYDKQLGSILQKADHHSSKERIDIEDTQEVLETPLISIFSQVNISDKISDDYYIPLTELDLNKDLYPLDSKKKVIGPYNTNLVYKYGELWKNFVDEFDKLKNKNFESCLAVVKKYTSTMPSAAYVSQSDISLYDHLKTTAAIANCRYLFSKEEKLLQTDTQDVYKIVTGDISGIQNFIYRVNSPVNAQKGMSKRLRGRSLYLSLLTEAIVNKLISDMHLDSSNILFCGGGRFTIIAPNTKKTDEVLKKVSSQVNNFFIKQFNAELYLALASTPACGNDLGQFGNILENLGIKLDLNKKHKFIRNLKKVFNIEDSVEYDTCIICGNKTVNQNEICDECKSHELLGQKASNAKYMIKYYASEELDGSNFFIDFLNVGFIFKKDKDSTINLVNEHQDKKFVIYKLNDTNFTEFVWEVNNVNVAFDFKFLPNVIPNIDGNPLYFEHLANLSKGSNKLGILKMDVDDLGKIFSKGFKFLADENKGSSISRISSLSFYMDLFFSGMINKIVSEFAFFENKNLINGAYDEIDLTFENEIGKKTVYKPNFGISDYNHKLGKPSININYAGGDDLLVIGPYDDIIEFSLKFRNQFKKWTAFNDSINLSGGIVLSNSKFPIGRAAILADGELEKSKGNDKNKLTIFNETIAWETNLDVIKGFDKILEFSKCLETEVENKKISKNFVYSLLNIWKLNYNHNAIFNDDWDDEMNRRIMNRNYIPQFKYKLRLIKDNEVRNKIDKYGVKYMPWIKIPVSWVSLRLR